MAPAPVKERRLTADATGVFELASVDFLSECRKVAQDASSSPELKEAAAKMVLVESHIANEDCERGLMAAREAAERYRKMQHSEGVLDAERLLVHVHCLHAEACRAGEGEVLKKGAETTLKAAAKVASDKASECKAAGDKRGEAAMLLASVEVSLATRDPKALQEAENSASAALKQAKEIGSVPLEACANLRLAQLASSGAQVAEHAELARNGFRKTSDKVGLAKALHLLGTSSVMRGKLEEGIDTCVEAAVMFRDMSEKKMEAHVYYQIAQMYLTRCMGREAAEYAEDAMVLFKKASAGINQAYAADLLVQALIVKGDSRQALRVANEGLELFKAKQDRRCQALMLASAGSVHLAKEDFEEAQKAFDEALSKVQELGDQRWEGAISQELSEMHLLRNSVEEAAAAASEAVSAYQAAGDRVGEAFALTSLLEVHKKKDDFYQATQVANEQRALFQETGLRSKEAASLLCAAGCLSSDQNLDQALALADEAQEICQDIEDARGEVLALMSQAEIHCLRDDSEPALEKAAEMRRRAKEIGDRMQEALACKAIANVHQAFERLVEAVRSANEAITLSKSAMYKPVVVEMMQLAVKVNMALVLEDGAQVSQRGAEKAVRPAKEAVTVAKATGKRSLISSTLYQLAEVQLMSYQLGLAMTSAKEALDIFRALEDRPGEAGAVILMAETHYAGGRYDKAEETAKEGIELATACGDQTKENYGQSLIQQIQESRKASLAAAKPQMVPMQMMPGMPQQAAAPASGAAAPEAAESLAAPKQVGLDAAMVSATVQEMARQAIGTDDEDLTLDSALMDSGMDSLTAVSFRNGLQQNLGVKLPSSLMFDYPTMKEVSNRIVELSIENA